MAGELTAVSIRALVLAELDPRPRAGSPAEAVRRWAEHTEQAMREIEEEKMTNIRLHPENLKFLESYLADYNEAISDNDETWMNYLANLVIVYVPLLITEIRRLHEESTDG